MTTREERDTARREAYDQRLAYLATRKGAAAAKRAQAKAEQLHRERLHAYEHGARGAMAHHHIPGSRLRSARKSHQRFRRVVRIARHPDDPRPWRVRKAVPA